MVDPFLLQIEENSCNPFYVQGAFLFVKYFGKNLQGGGKLRLTSVGKTLLCFFVLFSFVISFEDCSTAEAAYAYQAKVTADVLNVRSQPGTSNSVAGKLAKGKIVTVLEQKNGWSRVTYGTLKGWVASQFLANVSWNGFVTATNLYIRSTPGGRIMGTLPKNTSVTVYEKEGSWLKAYAPSLKKTGWVSSAYISTQKPAIQTVKVVLKSNANIRKGPGTGYSILSTAKTGTYVDKLVVKNGWIQVRQSNGVIGWVSGTLARDPADVLKGKVIVLDAGHGGYDSGAIGMTHYEKNLTLRTTLELVPLLQKAGAKVILTRSTDKYLTLAQRAAISNNNLAHAFLSLHYNAYSKTSTGTMTFYYSSSKDGALASTVQSGLAAATPLRSLGTKFGNYQVLRSNKRPAALVELGFISNPNEEEIMETTTYQKNAAKGLYNGLFRYFLTK